MLNVSVKEKPVVIEMTINRPWWRFEMNQAEFSAYFEAESEVLIQDGTCLQVMKVEEQKKEKETLTYIFLEFIGHGGFLS